MTDEALERLVDDKVAAVLRDVAQAYHNGGGNPANPCIETLETVARRLEGNDEPKRYIPFEDEVMYMSGLSSGVTKSLVCDRLAKVNGYEFWAWSKDPDSYVVEICGPSVICLVRNLRKREAPCDTP